MCREMVDPLGIGSALQLPCFNFPFKWRCAEAFNVFRKHGCPYEADEQSVWHVQGMW